jgi:DNA mismatch repair ATPase MutS
MAELRRLKQIVDQSAVEPTSNGRRMLYLLDEILQGTNSAERHVAVTRILTRLIATPSIGMVSTHDLELAHVPELQSACQIIHFRETFTGSAGAMQMTFDYQLRPGLAPTTNALKLLEFVGLGD